MNLTLATFPSASIRNDIPESDWPGILEAWCSVLSTILRLPGKIFFASANVAQCNRFIITYLRGASPKYTSEELHKKTLQLLHRLLTQHKLPPKELLKNEEFLLDLAAQYPPRSEILQQIFVQLWNRETEPVMTQTVQRLKENVCGDLTNMAKLKNLSNLFRASPKLAAYFLAGEDFRDAGASAGNHGAKLFQRALVEAARVNWTVVIDCLYCMTTNVSPLTRKVGALGLGEKLMELAVEPSDEVRVRGFIKKLAAVAPVKPKRRKDKGKGVAVYDHELEEKYSLDSKVSSVRDIFPEFGVGFVRKCLAAFNNNVEATIAALLENNLPADLATADHDESYESSSPPAATYTRRNIYDDDELDRLSPAALAKVSVGPRDDVVTLDTDKPSVASIMAALASFDPDDDDYRDDDDEEGPDITQLPGVQEVDPDERLMWKAYRADPDVFARAARGTQARRDLKMKGGWTDEALEGFATMLKRQPIRFRRLESLYLLDDDTDQEVVERSSWRDGDEEQASGRGRGRGRGGRGGGRGGSREPGEQDGPPNLQAVARGRARNEKNKARVGNHNRQAQRAKKMARGSPGPPA